MNDKELHNKVNAASFKLMKTIGVISPVEVLMEIGVLSKTDYENWRNGRVPYLEKVCKINLRKLSKINREIRVFAKKNNLKESWTFYKQWGRKNKKGSNGKNAPAIKLQFSKSGNEDVERQYAMHYVSAKTLDENKAQREITNPSKSKAEINTLTPDHKTE